MRLFYFYVPFLSFLYFAFAGYEIRASLAFYHLIIKALVEWLLKSGNDIKTNYCWPASLFLCSFHCDHYRQNESLKHTFLNIVLDNRNKFTPVRSSVFVPKADSVTNLVHNNPEFVAVLSYRNPLAPIPLPPNVGTAATRSVNRKYITQSILVSQSSSFINQGKEQLNRVRRPPENHQTQREGA